MMTADPIRSDEARQLTSHVNADTYNWFHDRRQQSQKRLDLNYLTNGQFIRLLLEVFEHHMEANPGPLYLEKPIYDATYEGYQSQPRDIDGNFVKVSNDAN